MWKRETVRGFTIVEMIITVVVMSLFVMFLFQAYMLGFSQRQGLVMRAAANDIAMTNLRKIISKSSPLLSGITCSSSNDLTATPPGNGTNITFSAEPLTNTPLPNSTTQTMKAFYPRGCNISYPVKILSIVQYNSETVSRATYVQ